MTTIKSYLEFLEEQQRAENVSFNEIKNKLDIALKNLTNNKNVSFFIEDKLPIIWYYDSDQRGAVWEPTMVRSNEKATLYRVVKKEDIQSIKESKELNEWSLFNKKQPLQEPIIPNTDQRTLADPVNSIIQQAMNRGGFATIIKEKKIRIFEKGKPKLSEEQKKRFPIISEGWYELDPTSHKNWPTFISFDNISKYRFAGLGNSFLTIGHTPK